ncbi:MAG: hypothetical protein ACJ8AO_11170 [Gemmatimonadaceae bacterium]
MRRALVGSFDERIPVLEAIADGEPVQRTRVPLAAILQHASCPKCGDALRSDLDVASTALIEIDGRTSATPKERICAIGVMGQYGLGPQHALSRESVKEKVLETDVVLRRALAPEAYAAVTRELRDLWNSL